MQSARLCFLSLLQLIFTFVGILSCLFYFWGVFFLSYGQITFEIEEITDKEHTNFTTNKLQWGVWNRGKRGNPRGPGAVALELDSMRGIRVTLRFGVLGSGLGGMGFIITVSEVGGGDRRAVGRTGGRAVKTMATLNNNDDDHQ